MVGGSAAPVLFLAFGHLSFFRLVLYGIVTLVGVVNIPIIKFSVDWWNTLHQPASVLRMGGPALHPSMLWPLLVMALGASLLFVCLHLMGVRNEILRRRLRRLSYLAAEAADHVLEPQTEAGA